jgi:hypothetical protein
MRMGMRRMTGLTNAFSKRVENLEHAGCSPLHALQLLPHSPDLRVPLELGRGHSVVRLGSDVAVDSPNGSVASWLDDSASRRL